MLGQLQRLARAPIATGVLILAVVVNTLLSHRTEVLVMNELAFGPEPWRFFTSVLPHVGPVHLLFNLYWVWALGVHFELERGPLSFLAFFAATAVASAGAEYGLFHGGVGLSGVGYGLFTYGWVVRRVEPSWAQRCPDGVVRTFVGWFFFCIITTVTGVQAVGNTAHAVGAAMGALWGLTQLNARVRRLGIAGALALVALGAASSYAPVRHALNLTDAVAYDDARAAYTLMIGEHPDNVGAERALRAAVMRAPTLDFAWFNLGIAASRQQHWSDAVTAYEKAYELKPSEPNREALEDARRMWVTELMTTRGEGDFDPAVRQLEALLGSKPHDPWAASVLGALLLKSNPERARALLSEAIAADAGEASDFARDALSHDAPPAR